MEFPLDEWIVLPEEEFELAAARDPGSLGVELLAQVRPNGRLLDHFRLVLGGSELIEVVVDSTGVFLFDGIPEARLHYSVWPRDIKIRRNMCTGEWLDLSELISANDIVAEGGAAAGEEDGADPLEGVKRFLLNHKDKNSSGSSVRWAVGVGADKRMELSLQLLPGAAATLNSKPTLRG